MHDDSESESRNREDRNKDNRNKMDGLVWLVTVIWENEEKFIGQKESREGSGGWLQTSGLRNFLA